MKNCQMDPLLCLIPGSFVHLLPLLVLAAGRPLSEGTAKVHLSQCGPLSSKLSAGPRAQTWLLKLPARLLLSWKICMEFVPHILSLKKILFGSVGCLLSAICQSLLGIHCCNLSLAGFSGTKSKGNVSERGKFSPALHFLPWPYV